MCIRDRSPGVLTSIEEACGCVGGGATEDFSDAPTLLASRLVSRPAARGTVNSVAASGRFRADLNANFGFGACAFLASCNRELRFFKDCSYNHQQARLRASCLDVTNSMHNVPVDKSAGRVQGGTQRHSEPRRKGAVFVTRSLLLRQYARWLQLWSRLAG